MNSSEVLQASFKNARETFLNMMDSLIILDIGVIDSVDLNGRAHVTSSTFIDNRPIIYSDAEVIFPGNSNGCFVTKCTGMACLIFLPKSCMPNVSDLKLRVGSTSYNRDGVKVMPIGNGSNNTVRSLFGEDGDYNVIGQTYRIQYLAGSVSFQRDDGSTALTIDQTGQMYITRQTDTGTLNINIEDTGIVTTWLSQNKDVLWTDTLNPDGSRSFVQVNPNDTDNPLFSMSIGTDGTVTINTAANINVTTAGDASVNADGDVSIDAENIKLNGDDRHLVAYEDLKDAMDKLYTALTTTAIAGNGSTQPAWSGLDPITKIDISKAKVDNVITGASSTP